MPVQVHVVTNVYGPHQWSFKGIYNSINETTFYDLYIDGAENVNPSGAPETFLPIMKFCYMIGKVGPCTCNYDIIFNILALSLIMLGLYIKSYVSLLMFQIKMSDRKAVIKNADMSEDMQQDSVDCATQALEKYNIEKDIAAYIKKEFDKKYNPTWHCIVGRNFGSYVTHETKHFIYFYLGQVAILLFKSG